MKLQILSDLHLDVNREQPFSLADSDTFTIICGDISGHINDTVKWINSNVKQGVFVEGNHIGYDNKRRSIQSLYQELSNQFPIDANVSHLNDNYKIVGDYVFVGGTLWTNYMLDGEGFHFYNKQVAVGYMNDFTYNYYNILDKNFDKENGLVVKKLTPDNCEKMFYKTKGVIREVCELFPDKKIVVVTHHAPSGQSIDERYLGNKANASYASNLESFIMEHPNIVLWCHGHIHANSDYMIGNCRVVCNPRGYERYKENLEFNSRYIIEV